MDSGETPLEYMLRIMRDRTGGAVVGFFVGVDLGTDFADNGYVDATKLNPHYNKFYIINPSMYFPTSGVDAMSMLMKSRGMLKKFIEEIS